MRHGAGNRSRSVFSLMGSAFSPNGSSLPAPASEMAIERKMFVFVYVKLLLTALFWGGTFVAGRVLADHVPPSCSAFLRFCVASSILVPLVHRTGEGWPRLDRRQTLAVISLGLTGVFAYNLFFFQGLRLVPAGRASLIVATNPVFILLFSACFFRERLCFLDGLGVALSVAGAVVVISRGAPMSLWNGGVGWGDVLIFGCVASWVAFSLLGKHVLSGMSPLTSVTCASVTGTLALLPLAWADGLWRLGPALTITDILAVLYLGLFGTVIGFVWYYDGIRAIGPGRDCSSISFPSAPLPWPFRCWGSR